jgi:hypothetical protein
MANSSTLVTLSNLFCQGQMSSMLLCAWTQPQREDYGQVATSISEAGVRDPSGHALCCLPSGLRDNEV